MAEGNSCMSKELNKTHPEYANYLNVMCAEMSCILCIPQTVALGQCYCRCLFHVHRINLFCCIYVYIFFLGSSFESILC